MSFVSNSTMGKMLSKRLRSARSAKSRPSAPALAREHGTHNQDGAGSSRHQQQQQLLHTDAVDSVASVEPGLCLSGSKNKTIILFDYNKKQLIEKWTGHSGAITKVCYGSHCRYVFSASRDMTVRMWTRGNANSVKEFSGHSLVVTSVHVNQDNTKLCSGSRDNSVKLWDVEAGTCVRTNSIPQNLVTDVKFVPNSFLVVQTGEDKEVRMFDHRTLESVFSFPKKQHIQMCCDVSPDGYYVVTSSNGFCGNGCEATLWDMRSRKLHLEYKGHTEAVDACLFLPGGESNLLVATASRDHSVRVWNQRSGVCQCEYIFDGTGPLTSLAANQDGMILVGSFKQGVQCLRLEDKSLVKVMSY